MLHLANLRLRLPFPIMIHLFIRSLPSTRIEPRTSDDLLFNTWTTPVHWFAWSVLKRGLVD